MAVALQIPVDVNALTEEQLEERATQLEQEAEQHRILARSLFMECAKLRARAERMRREEQEAAEKRAKKGRAKKNELPYDPQDPLIAAAVLAVEDLGAGFDAGDLAGKLRIGRERALKLLLAVVAKGFCARQGEGKWRSVDPNEPRVRDAARELGRFTVEQLGEAVHMEPTELTYYIDWMREENMISGAGPMYEYVKIGPELLVTKVNDGRYRLPEKQPPAGTEILSPRGQPLYTPNHGDRGRRMSQPGQKHKMKLRDQRREDMKKAREESAEKAKAKQTKDPHAAKRAKAAAKRRARSVT